MSPYVINLVTLVFGVVLAAGLGAEERGWSASSTPLPVFLPEPYALPDLPQPLPYEALRVDLGQGQVLVPAQAMPSRSLDGQWRCSGLTTSTKRFAESEQLDRGWQNPDFDDQQWDTLAVPLDWYRAYPKARTAQEPFVMGWYRRSFELGDEAEGKRAVLHFGVAGYEADLWVNGHLAGSHHGDFTPWDIDIGAWTVPGKNILALRIRSDFGPNHGAGPARHAYGSQWSISNIKGGLWQSCRLTLDSPLRIAQLAIAPQWEQQSLRLDWQLSNQSGSDAQIAMRAIVQAARLGHESEPPIVVGIGSRLIKPGASDDHATIPVPGLRPWSPDRPELYWLTVLIEKDGKVIASRSERFGFRNFVARDGKFWLNGAPCYLFGENLAAIKYGGQGETPEAYAERVDHDLQGLKRNGYNIFRNAHMPIEPLVLERADELGLMVYNEWAWCFSDELDPEEFPQRNDQELREWVSRDTNHASVVMWSCGNEVHYQKDLVRTELNRQVATVRSLEHSGRPISTFSGAAYGYGDQVLDSDVLDQHTYFGLGSGAWSGWERNVGHAKKFLNRVYGAGWPQQKPFIQWETVGFSWGQISDPNFKLNDPEAYLAYAERPSSWGQPAGIGFSGSIGLAASLDPARGTRHGRQVYGRRIGEFIRRDATVAGFAPWFQDPDLEEARQWTQPVLVSIYSADNHLALRHPFIDRTYEQQVMVLNNGATPLAKATARLTLMGADGIEQPLASVTLPEVAVAGRVAVPVTFTIPEKAGPGWWQLRVRVEEAGKECSRLGYDLFLTAESVTRTPVEKPKEIALLPGSGRPAVQRWLRDLGVPSRDIESLRDLGESRILLLPPGGAMTDDEGVAVRTWVRTGGTLVVLEQAVGKIAAVNQRTVPADNTFVDLVMPAHPLFAGLDQATFDTSDHPLEGRWIAVGVMPLTANVLAARGKFLDIEGALSAAVSEGTLGKGRILISQILALEQWNRDGVASHYLRNLATYVASAAATPATGIRPWPALERRQVVVTENCRPVDLHAAVNRSFRDTTDHDGAGGWTDQGDNDFRSMPLGAQTIEGVPFEILDPSQNNDRSCLVLGGGGRKEFPLQASGIVIGEAVSRVFFMHTAAWVSGSSVTALTYRMHYADGSVVDVPVRTGQEIADWWNPQELPSASLAISRTNSQDQAIGAYLMTWENPFPDRVISNMDVVSSGAVVPIVIAVSVERTHPQPGHFASTGDAKAWHAVVDWPGTGVANDGEGLPEVSLSAQRAPNETTALRITFPASPAPATDDGAWWGTPTLFSTLAGVDVKSPPAAPYHYLTFWVLAENDGVVEVVLPLADWSDSLKTTLTVHGTKTWTKVRLALRSDFELARSRPWTIADLRGELFLFHGRHTKRTSPRPVALVLTIADIRLE